MIGDANMTTFCGTPLFFAPEILMGEAYNEGVDYWALGVITYILLSGKPPFESEDEMVLFEKIKKQKV
jgi:serine/threonine protein kinase